MIFKQIDLKLNRKEFIIEKDGLRVISKSISGRSEDYYDFEDIGDKTTRETKRLLIPLFISLLFIGWGTIMLIGTLNGGKYGDYAVHFYYVTGLICFSIFYFFGKNYLYLSHKRNTTHIQFLNNNPTKKKLEQFIQKIQETKKISLLEKYGEFDEDKTYEEHRQQLKWLKDNNYLTKDEFKSRLINIKSNYQFSNDSELPKIGFKKEN